MTRASTQAEIASARLDTEQPALTVAICTYNGAERLPEVLERLKKQIGTEAFKWEVLIVDNNSSDRTQQVVRQYQENWLPTVPFRCLFEPRQGAAYARTLAIKEASSELVGFLDDDNLPAMNWVISAYSFGQEHPQAGAYGSQITGLFEGALPPNFRRVQSFLAITQRGQSPHIYNPWLKVLPPSAGLVVRKAVWLDYVPEQLILTGRHDGHMLTGEDIEALSYIQLSPWEVWHNPAMKVDHKIPEWRLQREYLMPFFRGVGLGRHVTRMLSVRPWQRPLVFLLYMTNDLRKLVHHLLIYRTKLKTDLIPACEMQLYLSSLLSPFYICWLTWSRKRAS